ncbi:MAG: hypothetical protein K0R36_1545 [Chryseobacterium sp.]|jgi:hypothetical protein|nr:hypothetical protein [Chryseobacterium sp.]
MLEASLQNNLDSYGNRRFEEVNDKNNVDFERNYEILLHLFFPL